MPRFYRAHNKVKRDRASPVSRKPVSSPAREKPIMQVRLMGRPRSRLMLLLEPPQAAVAGLRQIA